MRNYRLMKQFYVYITTNPGKTVLYVGITNDLRRRIFEHYNNRGNQKTFAGKYYCYRLVYWELFNNARDAIFREKEIKNMSRLKKEKLIAHKNPNWYFMDVLSK